MNKTRLGWIMEDPTKKPQEHQEKPQKPEKPILRSLVKPQKNDEIRYYRGKYKVEFIRKTLKGYICKALTPFRSGLLTVEVDDEFLANPRFLWKTKLKEEIVE